MLNAPSLLLELKTFNAVLVFEDHVFVEKYLETLFLHTSTNRNIRAIYVILHIITELTYFFLLRNELSWINK